MNTALVGKTMHLPGAQRISARAGEMTRALLPSAKAWDGVASRRRWQPRCTRGIRGTYTFALIFRLDG